MSKEPITGSNWYFDYHIRDVLTSELGARVHICPATVVEGKELLDQNVLAAIAETIIDGQPSVIPIHMDGNHWAAMIIKCKEDGGLQVIYNDPLGHPLVSAASVVATITGIAGQQVDIRDLSKRQQINGDDCGVFTADNLIKLATQNTNLPISEIRALIRPEEDAYNLRVDHARILGQAEPVLPRGFEAELATGSTSRSNDKERYVDSSDSEAEERMRVEKGIRDKDSYVRYLMADIFSPREELADPDVLKQKLGLMLHNYADRVFNSGEMRESYRRMKEQMLTIGDEEYFAAAGRIEDFVDKECKELLEGTDTLKVIGDRTLKAENYVRIYNHIFSRDVSLPVGITVKVSEEADIRKLLKARLISFNKEEVIALSAGGGSDNLMLKILSSSPEELEFASKELLSFSQVIGRRDRREMKGVVESGLKRSRRDSFVSVSSKDDVEAKKDTRLMHFLHGASGKDQTLMPSLGTYASSVKPLFGKTEEEARVMARRIKAFVKTRVPDYEAQKVGHLMFVTEVQRSRSTAFTAAMFLDEVERTGRVDITRFPMEMKGAVDAIRDLHEKHYDALPATRRFDEGKASKELSRDILLKEGELFIDWLVSNGENGLHDSINALKSSLRLNKTIEKNLPEEPKDFQDLRDSIIRFRSGTEVPLDYTEFKSWAVHNSIGDKLKDAAFQGFEEKIENGIIVLERNILEEWYSIDTSKLFAKQPQAREVEKTDVFEAVRKGVKRQLPRRTRSESEGASSRRSSSGDEADKEEKNAQRLVADRIRGLLQRRKSESFLCATSSSKARSRSDSGHSK